MVGVTDFTAQGMANSAGNLVSGNGPVMGGLMVVLAVVVVTGVVGLLAWWIIRWLQYNIKINILMQIGDTLYMDTDMAMMRFDKLKRIAKFKLKKRGVDLSNVVNKTIEFIPTKTGAKYSRGMMLLQTGEDKEIDSYQVIRPTELQLYLTKKTPLTDEERISGVSKTAWLLNEKMIQAFEKTPWWASPGISLAITGFSAIFIILLIIFGGKMIQDIITQATSANVLTEKTLQAMIQATHNLELACGHVTASGGASGLPPA